MRIKKNVGRLDRTLRLITGAALLLTGLVVFRGQAIFMVFGLAMLAVGFIGFCPAYLLFGISTRKQA